MGFVCYYLVGLCGWICLWVCVYVLEKRSWEVKKKKKRRKTPKTQWKGMEKEEEEASVKGKRKKEEEEASVKGKLTEPSEKKKRIKSCGWPD